MLPQQKEAWFHLILVAICALLYGAAAWWLGYMPALGVFGLLGLAGLTPLFYLRRRRGERFCPGDERDKMIALSATAGGFAIFWVTFVVACMTIWWIVRSHSQTVSVNILPLIVLGGWIIFWISRATFILLLYRRS